MTNYKPIPGFETTHEISEGGIVRRTKTGYELNSFKGVCGKMRVIIEHKGRRKNIGIQRLVSQLFQEKKDVPVIDGVSHAVWGSDKSWTINMIIGSASFSIKGFFSEESADSKVLEIMTELEKIKG